MSRGGYGPYGARPPSPSAYFVALGGVTLLLLALVLYCLYFCCSKVKELSAADVECQQQQPLPPSANTSTAYPVQPGIREGARAMARLCRQLPTRDVDVTSPSTHDTSLASHTNEVTSHSNDVSSHGNDITSHSNDVMSHSNDVTKGDDVTSVTCSTHDISVTYDTSITSRVTHGTTSNSNDDTSNLETAHETSVSEKINDLNMKSDIIPNDAHSVNNKYTTRAKETNGFERKADSIMNLQPDVFGTSVIGVNNVMKLKYDVNNDLKFVDGTLKTPENTSTPTQDSKTTPEIRNNLESPTPFLQNDVNPAYVANVTSTSARDEFFSPKIYENNRFYDNRFATRQTIHSNDVTANTGDVALNGQKVIVTSPTS